MTRLQGAKFAQMRPYLEMLGYQVSRKGNIKAIMRLKGHNEVQIGGYIDYMYCHWLNPAEILKFENSDYYKNNPAIKGEQLYAKYPRKLKQIEEARKALDGANI